MLVSNLDEIRMLLRDERIRQEVLQSDIPGVGRSTIAAFESSDSGGARVDTLFAILERLGCKLSIELPGATVERDSVHVEDDEIDMVFSLDGGR